MIYGRGKAPLVDTHTLDTKTSTMLSIDMLTIHVPDRTLHPEPNPQINREPILLHGSSMIGKISISISINISPHSKHSVGYPFYVTCIPAYIHPKSGVFNFDGNLINNVFAYCLGSLRHYRDKELKQVSNIISVFSNQFRLNQLLEPVKYIFNKSIATIASETFNSEAKVEIEKAIKHKVRVEAKKKIITDYYNKYKEQIYTEPLKNTIKKTVEELTEKIYNHIMSEEYALIVDSLVKSIDTSKFRKDLNSLFLDQETYYVIRKYKVRDKIMKRIKNDDKDVTKRYTKILNIAISLVHYALPVKLWKVKNDWLRLIFNIEKIFSEEDLSQYDSKVTYKIEPTEILIELREENINKAIKYDIILHFINSVIGLYLLMQKTDEHSFAPYSDHCYYLIFTLNI